MKDSYKLKGLRKRLVEDLSKKGINDPRILKAIGNIPRHYFLDTAFAEHAYEDKPFPIGEGQTISQPYTVAYQTQLLEAEKEMKVLEIGTGSGYQCSVLAEMGIEVYSIERVKKLYDKATFLLQDVLKYKVHLYFGDGTLGLPGAAPFDRILVTAAAPDINENFLLQLKIGGKLVIPTGSRKVQQMIRVTRTGERDFQKEYFEDFRFVPLIGEKGWRK